MQALVSFGSCDIPHYIGEQHWLHDCSSNQESLYKEQMHSFAAGNRSTGSTWH